MDDGDIAYALSEPLLLADVADIRAAAASIPDGKPGICGECEEHKPRIVDGLCARCRDILADYKRRTGRR